ncbi:MAG: endonuclease V [Phycisphaerae bacterium]
MKIRRAPHVWLVAPKRAVEIQHDLARRVVRTGCVRDVSLVAGADLAFMRGSVRSRGGSKVGDARSDYEWCIAGVVVWDVRTREVVEQHVVRRRVRFPYLPGLLSFREAPALLTVLRKLRCEPSVFMFDGQGLAHPRRCGLACHVGVVLDRPSLGCAKSVLVGTCDDPLSSRGSTSPLVHRGERIGMSLRTRANVKPVYVSVGHRLSLSAAVGITLACSVGYRLPEPVRLADQLVARRKRRLLGVACPGRSVDARRSTFATRGGLL